VQKNKCRIVAAKQYNIPEAVSKFKEDLYYRLNKSHCHSAAAVKKEDIHCTFQEIFVLILPINMMPAIHATTMMLNSLVEYPWARGISLKQWRSKFRYRTGTGNICDTIIKYLPPLPRPIFIIPHQEKTAIPGFQVKRDLLAWNARMKRTWTTLKVVYHIIQRGRQAWRNPGTDKALIQKFFDHCLLSTFQKTTPALQFRPSARGNIWR